MYITFPADDKVKARLDAVCKSLEITYEKWFETALLESEHDVLTELVSGDESDWMWDANLCRFVRRGDVDKVLKGNEGNLTL
jgi:predicted transcriptional regulator